MASVVAGHSVLDSASPVEAKALSGVDHLDGFKIASRHSMVKTVPGPTFFEGMLLGNGDVGVCAVVRPDALGVHISKSDCWDIRVSEGSEKEVATFADILKMWQRASEEAKQNGRPDAAYLESSVPFFREYSSKVGEPYEKKWPRPWPCGTMWINWDPRWVEPIRYSLNPASGLFTLELKETTLKGATSTHRIRLFVDWDSGLVSLESAAPVPLVSVTYSPHVDGFHAGAFDPGRVDARPESLPPPEVTHVTGSDMAEFSCFQYFPAIGPTKERPISPKSDKDRNFSLRGRLGGLWSATVSDSTKSTIFSPTGVQKLRLDVLVATPRDLLLKELEHQSDNDRGAKPWITIPQTHVYSSAHLDTLGYLKKEMDPVFNSEFTKVQQLSESRWREHWSKSSVAFQDEDLERTWYHNQYFLACCLRKNKTAPGLFANWTTGEIGSAWHSDYHLDYNCQQVYWGVFSSNHVDMHHPYLELCENLLPMSEKFAHDSFGLPGAFFPLSAFPVPSQIVPYPVPPWAYQVCMTPWAVQSLWWQYLYTQDENYLRHAYPVIRSAARFLATYVKKGSDARYHIAPSVSSENWGFTVDFRMNKDCILDLSLVSFVLNAVVLASEILGVDSDERSRWSEIHNNLALYPTDRGPYGEVWLDISNAPVEHVYNVPITLAPVFPGEQVGLGKGKEFLDIAVRTARTNRLEGGNDLVSQPLIRARLGILDLQWFKGQVQYCLLPSGMSNDRVRQTGGRYSQSTDFDFLMRMGLWCENFAVPVVLNECMLQSYTGVLYLFPNTTNLGPAQFENLRAVGAFLVSASYDGSKVTRVTILSERGKTMRMVSPWPNKSPRATRVRDGKRSDGVLQGRIFAFETEPGESYSIHPE
jgi:alpha-L-fucosidase 2